MAPRCHMLFPFKLKKIFAYFLTLFQQGLFPEFASFTKLLFPPFLQCKNGAGRVAGDEALGYCYLLSQPNSGYKYTGSPALFFNLLLWSAAVPIRIIVSQS